MSVLMRKIVWLFGVVTSRQTQHAIFSQMLDRSFDANQFGVLFGEDTNTLSLSSKLTHILHLPTLPFHSLYKSATLYPPTLLSMYLYQRSIQSACLVTAMPHSPELFLWRLMVMQNGNSLAIFAPVASSDSST